MRCGPDTVLNVSAGRLCAPTMGPTLRGDDHQPVPKISVNGKRDDGLFLIFELDPLFVTGFRTAGLREPDSTKASGSASPGVKTFPRHQRGVLSL